ncbi:MAG: high-affinity branched-chain amino acid ABC transporter permease LivM, partial [Alphaproteobacteria bacterium]
AEKGMNYVGVICVAIFVVVTAMGLLLLARRGWKLVSAQAASSSAAAFARSSSISSEFAQQITPAMLIIAVFLPVLAAGSQQSYAVDIAVLVLIYIILGWGLNIVVGLAGMLDLGYVAFYAIGAYTYVLLSHYFGLSFWVCLPIAALLASLWGVILGFPVLRLRGDYLAIVTLAFGEIIRIVVENWGSLTNGPQGMAPSTKLTLFGLSFGRYDDNTFHQFFGIPHDPAYRIIFLYYVVFMVVIAVYFITMRLRKLPIARAWEALREDEIACRSLGINTVTTKLTAFAMGAMFGGIAGPFIAARSGSSIFPESFKFEESALVLAIVVLGGLGSQTGIVIAAAVLVGSSEFFRDLEEYRMLLFGMAMVSIMVWRPRGLISTRIPTVALKESKTISADLVKEGVG